MSIFREELKTLKKYVPGKPIEEVKKEYGLTDIVKLASNENPLGASPEALKALKNSLDQAHIYPDGGATELSEKVAEYYGIKANQIMFGNGGEEIIEMLASAMIGKGDEAIFAWPSFSLYDIATGIMGGKSVKIPTTSDFKHDFEAFKKAINDKTKIVFICNPNNPTGNIMTKKEIEDFALSIPEHIVLVLDEAYFEFARVNKDYPDGLELLAKRTNTVIIRTFSKVAGLAGLRIGYMMSSASIIEEMTKVKNVFNCNRFAQIAGLAAISDRAHISKTVELNYISLGMMEEFCDHHNLSYAKPNANFIWIDVARDSHEINEELLKRGVIIRPGFLWGYDNYIRVSTGTIEQTQRFIDAMEEILG